MPKEIIFLDKLPLTAVGKPIKHLLQVDAADRALRAALQPLAGDWRLVVENTGGSGLKVVLTLPPGCPQARAQADALLSAYALRYEIRDGA